MNDGWTTSFKQLGKLSVKETWFNVIWTMNERVVHTQLTEDEPVDQSSVIELQNTTKLKLMEIKNYFRFLFDFALVLQDVLFILVKDSKINS